ncbi:MAG: SDR family oxidoreductase [Candidatus Lokiarchaeota archaeon]|nr:SDR family oxidoreductase [Candidatus Lokiarchaeota archaeon]
MDLGLKDKIAIVTGGASGIGRQTCIDLIAEGVKVVIADINEAGAKEVEAEIIKIGGEAIAIKCDVTINEDVKNTVKACMDKFRRVDILVNNAGIIKDNMIHKMPEEDYDLVMNINLKGYWRFCKEVVPIMKQQKSGNIVMISSQAYKGNRGQSNYSPAKAGAVALTKTLAQELGYVGVRVNCVAPGLIQTTLTKDFVDNPKLRKNVEENLILKREGALLGTPKDISNAILFLVSEMSSYITGIVIDVAAGRKM